jgi:hypothetical protein
LAAITTKGWCPIQTPATRFVSPRSSCLGWIAFFLLFPVAAFSQGFGTMKTNKVVLHRKLPAVIHLTATTISIKTTSRVAQQSEAARLLAELLQTDLLKHENSLTVDDNSANVNIFCTITNLDTPPRQTYSRDEPVLEKGKLTQRKKTYFKIAGTLDVDVRVADHSGKTLDSNDFSAKYAREFEQPGNQPADEHGANSVLGTFSSVTRHLKPGATPDAPPAPPTASELVQDLVRNIVSLVTPRLVNTNETVEIPLAQGKLEEANKLAAGSLWSRDLESLETMAPFSNPQDDAYRLYNIGVANEALGYQSEDHATAKKFLSEAAINYGKAIDAKPTEKNFISAQNRIEIAVTYYKKLEERGLKKDAGSPEPSVTPKTTAASPSSETRSKASAALTNEKVIEMFKSGVDESSIIAVIHEARVVQFDLSADGLIDLAKNGIKGKILEAMRARARSANPTRGPNGGE